MNILYLANNTLGWRIAKILRDNPDDTVVAAALPCAPHAKCRREILDALDLPPQRIIPGERINDPKVHEQVRPWQPDMILSVLFDTILKPETIALAPRGAINLHNSYLPYNRGNYANVWAIVNQTPAGATLHVIDGDIDTGPIIDRIEVPIDPKDTGQTLYHKIEHAAEDLFRNAWPKIKAGDHTLIDQKNDHPTHKKRDVEKIDPIDPEKHYRAADLINILRARTFPPYPGAYIEIAGRKIYLRLQLLDESDL